MKIFEDYVKEWFEEFVDNCNDLDSLFDKMIGNAEDCNDKKELLLSMDADSIYEKLFYDGVWEETPATDQFLNDMFMQYVTEYLDNCYHDFAKEIVENMASKAIDYDNPLGFFSDLMKGGCASGMIGMFIYNHDCMEFYKRHANEMEEYREEMEEEYGSPLNSKDMRHYVWMCWLCYEDIAYRIGTQLFPDNI